MLFLLSVVAFLPLVASFLICKQVERQGHPSKQLNKSCILYLRTKVKHKYLPLLNRNSSNYVVAPISQKINLSFNYSRYVLGSRSLNVYSVVPGSSLVSGRTCCPLGNCTLIVYDVISR